MIRNAVLADLPAIEKVYAIARGYMARTGNPTQWGTIYPRHELLVSDIEKKELFVCEEEGAIRGVFAFILGDDPTYAEILGGQWLNDAPYAVIHRIAVSKNGRGRGVAKACFDYAFSRCQNLKIDTHRDNIPMQKALDKNGFKYCGIIHTHNGSERIAFQKTE